MNTLTNRIFQKFKNSGFSTMVKKEQGIGLLDFILPIVALLLVFTQAKIFFFHVIFVTLTFGAFYWKFRPFVIRSIFWVMLVATVLLITILDGAIPAEELVEIPLLSTILVLVFVIARQRAKAEKALRQTNEELECRVEERTAELTSVNFELTEAITQYKQTERTRRKLSSVVEQTADIVIITDKEGIIEYVNPAFEKELGYSMEEVINQTPRILKSGQHNLKFYEELWGTILSGEVYSGVLVNKKKSGELYFEEKTITPIRDSHENITHFVSTSKDITERKQAEEALRESEERYRRLVELSFEAIVIHSAGKIVHINMPAVELLGASGPGSLLGKPILDFVHSDYLTAVQARVEQLQSEGKGVPLIEEKFIRLDGTTVDVEVAAVPITFKGQPAVQTVIRDITARKQAEAEREKLLKTEHEQRLLAETLGEVFLTLTAHINRDGVLDEILRQARRLVSYSAANIVLLNGDTLYIARHHGYQAYNTRKMISNLEQPLTQFPIDAEVVQSRQSIIVPDTSQNSQWVTTEPEMVWIKSFIAMPICLRDRVVGLLRLDGDTANKFSAKDVERLQPLAHAAAIALKNARQYNQAQREITEQIIQAEAEIAQLNTQLRTLQYAGATIASGSGLQNVLNTVAEQMASLIKVEGCIIFAWNQETNIVSLIAKCGLATLWEKGLMIEAFPLADFPLAARALVERRPQQIVGYSSIYPAESDYMQKIQLKTLLVVPMEFQDRVVGLVQIMKTQTKHRFTNREIGLIQLLANQLASIIENTRLYEQVRQEISERMQVEKELRKIAAKNQAILDAIPDSIFQFSHDGRLLDYRIHSDHPVQGVLGDVAIGNNLRDMLPPDLAELTLQHIDKVLETHQMQIIEFQLPIAPEARDFETRLVANGHDEVLGIISDITERKARAAAIEHERLRIARDLHDSLGQSLGYLHLKLGTLSMNDVRQKKEQMLQQELSQMSDVANEAYEIVRSMLAAARPTDSIDLGTALLADAKSVGNRASFTVQLNDEGEPFALSPIVQQQVLKIFKEALSNVEKHAHAKRVDINVVWTTDALNIIFSDDGCGYDTSSPRPDGHYGLAIMEERVEDINGFLSVTSKLGIGTEVNLLIRRHTHVMIPVGSGNELKSET